MSLAAAPLPGSARPDVFVTGTGTEVGKSYVAAAIARTLATNGLRTAVFKPAVSGLDDPAPAGFADHQLLRLAAGSGQSDDEIAPYRYGPAVSPHLAAELTGSDPVDPAVLRRAATAAEQSADALVCEGVGGLLVPLNRSGYLVRDLITDLGLPVVIAAGPGLGTINHTLLTIAACRAASIAVRAVVLTPWPESPDSIQASNRDTITELGVVPVLGLPEFDVRADAWPSLAVPAR